MGRTSIIFERFGKDDRPKRVAEVKSGGENRSFGSVAFAIAERAVGGSNRFAIDVFRLEERHALVETLVDRRIDFDVFRRFPTFVGGAFEDFREVDAQEDRLLEETGDSALRRVGEGGFFGEVTVQIAGERREVAH